MTVKLEGKTIKLGNVEYVMPPLPLVKMSKVTMLMRGGDIMGDPEYVKNLCEAILWSLQRNYPELKLEEVVDNLDMANFKGILDAFMEVNMFKTGDVKEGEVTAK